MRTDFDIDNYTTTAFPINQWDGKPRRSIKATWKNGDRREVTLSVNHWSDRKQFAAIVSDASIPEDDGVSGFTVRMSSPMDATQVGREPVARYSKKALTAYFEKVMADPTVRAAVMAHAEYPTAPTR
jgi:hypothetical protein